MSGASAGSFGDAAEAAEAQSQTAGVPLGGVGAGCCELGRDGRFRNVTINNNRTVESRIDVIGGTLMAVRAARRGKVAARILQTESALPFNEAGIAAPYTASQRLAWRGVYPCSHYKLDDPGYPLEITWTALTPIVPYDHEASTLPLIFFSFYVQNPTEVSYDVSLVMNWENICGCARGHFPEKRGPVRPVLVNLETDKKHADGGAQEADARRLIAGLEFGFREEYRTNHEGNYALLIGQQRDVQVTMMGWNERNPRELEVFWNQFHDDGRLGNKLSRDDASHSGALCGTFDLAPQQTRNVVFVLAWYCPKYVVRGVDQGNGYTNNFKNAIEIATQGLTYHQYYFRAVEDWQRRIMTSTLPQWFSKALINNNYVLSTNTLFTRGNDFAMFETPADPRASTLDRRLYSSIGSLLFFPNFEEGELACIARTKDSEAPGRIYRQLGAECVHQPSHGEGEMLDTSIAFVLMAYRNYFMTGKRFILDHLFARVTEAMAFVNAHDIDGDGLPEQSGCAMTRNRWVVYGANSYICGLWITALRAYARLARRLGEKDEALKYEELLPRALESFDRKLWYEEGGYYRFYCATGIKDAPQEFNNACDAAQLAGQWYADFLCLGQLFPPEKVRKALGAICKLNDLRHGIAQGIMPDGSPCANPDGAGFAPEVDRAWPAFDMGHYASLMIAHGYPDRGLFTVQKNCKNVHARRGRVFNQPMMWDLEANNACGWGQDRHMGSMTVWHVLYALQGFHLNVPDGVLWFRPHLPIGVFSLSAPLFTPISFGWVRFREDDEKTYRQFVQLNFDSPIYLKTLVLRVPAEVEDVAVLCESENGVEDTDHIFGFDGSERLIEIMAKKPIMIGGMLKVSLTQTRGGLVRLPRPGSR